MSKTYNRIFKQEPIIDGHAYRNICNVKSIKRASRRVRIIVGLSKL